MIKKYILLLSILSMALVLNAQEYKTYEMEMVESFQIGSGEGQLALGKGGPIGGPSAIAFDSKGNLYISDTVNKKLVIFDSSNNYIKSLNNVYSDSAKRLFIDNSKKQILTFFSSAFGIDDFDGNKVSLINLRKSSYKNTMDKTPVYIYQNDTVFTYLKDGSLISIPNPTTDNDQNMQKIMDKAQTIKYLQENKTRSDKEIIIDEEDNVIVNGEITTQEFKKYFKHKNKIKKTTRSTQKHVQGFKDEMFAKFRGTYLGQDKDKNTYWWGGSSAIFVFNSDAYLIGAFKYDRDKSQIIPAVHPSGDVYFLDYDDKGVYLYKIARKW